MCVCFFKQPFEWSEEQKIIIGFSMPQKQIVFGVLVLYIGVMC